jgi:hypothetical protein
VLIFQFIPKIGLFGIIFGPIHHFFHSLILLLINLSSKFAPFGLLLHFCPLSVSIRAPLGLFCPFIVPPLFLKNLFFANCIIMLFFVNRFFFLRALFFLKLACFRILSSLKKMTLLIVIYFRSIIYSILPIVRLIYIILPIFAYFQLVFHLFLYFL